MQKKHFLIVTLGLLVSLLVLANLPFGRQWLTSQTTPAKSLSQSLPASTCNPSKQACDYALPDGSTLHLDIQPKPIKPMHTLKLFVQIKNQGVQPNAINRVLVELVGTEMDMGFNQASLTQQPNGQFVGELSIPVCTTGKMRWQITLMLDGTSRLSIPFYFEAG